ncbi:MAG: ATP-binding protein [Acidobacteria bacterium]|nr:ATP-binding protein [Acidobacteriota bacterium]
MIDLVGHIPFNPDAASLFYQLVSSRYEQSSLIVSSNKTFSAWAEIFGDAVAVEAMVDRVVHHSHIRTLKGDFYRLKNKHDELATTNDNR